MNFGDSRDNNVYYHPENCGLKLIGDLEDENACWDFHTLIVVQEIATGAIYAVHDRGCSCPVPFEDVRSFADMTPIQTLDDLKGFIQANSCSGWTSTQRQALYRKVRKVLAQ